MDEGWDRDEVWGAAGTRGGVGMISGMGTGWG